MNAPLLLLIATGAAICATSCASKRPVPFRTDADRTFAGLTARFDYATYSRIPNTPTSAVYRFCLKTIPYTRKRAFWGNWGGSGCNGGAPVDAMDEIFRLHDIAYTEVRTLRTMRCADRTCVEALKRLEPTDLTAEAREYRDRAVAFFSDPLLSLIGKPALAFLRLGSEPSGVPLKSEDDMRRLFRLEENVPLKTPSPSMATTVPAARDPGARPPAPARAEMTASATVAAVRKG
jgi:hypothetical protein